MSTESEASDLRRMLQEAVARASKAERAAERRKRHILELLLPRLRNAGERIRELERALPRWANVPTIETLVKQRDEARAELESARREMSRMRIDLEISQRELRRHPTFNGGL